MEKDFVKDMDFSQVIKYKKPCIITMSGLPGSGKVLFAQKLSRELKIYLLSNDYIRNYYYSLIKDKSEEERLRIQSITEEISLKRLIKILAHHIPFVMDRDFNSTDQFKKFILISKFLNYELIKIKINSNDNDNINRISQRIFDLDAVDDSIIGDNVSYSSPFPESVYYEIKERKPRMLNDTDFNYTINNFGSKQEFEESTDKVIDDIKSKILLPR